APKARRSPPSPTTPARRSAQTALWHITQAMLRWMAPFLSFTAEEAWAVFAPGGSGTVFTETYWAFASPDEALLAKWARIRDVRDAVNKEIEAVRASGGLGSSLQANVSIHANPQDHALLASLGDALKLVLITSAAELHADRSGDTAALGIQVTPSTATKCARCWHWRDDVGHDPAHPGLCGRCTSSLFGAGERREVA
ncbi:MAG: class I tRNA ligase family protein, partial [Rubrivivax sp.]